jgi:hypothetical protein
VVIDADGRVQKIIVGNSWTSDELAEELAKAAAVKPKSETRNHQEAKVPEPGK